ncbi:crossover junction endonuclease MUS81 [Culicoides brevitarsis]|uniref:crossover junction endonuclease MUS81 n=1 Tax=Culicoides brevitarsis TaxID=469753 RepID=UPI00307BFDDF
MCDPEPKRTRITLTRTCPNPLFEKWLNEFISEAEKKDAKSQFQLKKALTSLQKFPLPLNTGRDCIILEGFGKGICSLLDQKLEKYIKNNMRTVGNENIVELSESFRSSEVYLKEQRKEKEEILQAVTKELVKDGIVPLRKKPSAPKKSKKVPNTKIFEPFTFETGSYEIILLVDTQETAGKSKSHLDRTIQELNRYNVKFEVRRLSVGDFLWIAKNESGKELVLPFIVERKRKDDLASSIKDGRYYEQKYRLKNCGLSNVVYLIESIGNGNEQHLGMPVQNLIQATVNTRIQSNFQVKFTENNPHSMMYLHTMTEFLKKIYREKLLVSCLKADLEKKEKSATMEYLMEFEEFNKASTKKGDPTVQEIFVKQLLQLKGLSVDKAIAIVEVYPTPKSLQIAYKNCFLTKDAENLLADIVHGPLRKPIGPAISKTLHQLYTNKDPS